MMKGTHVQLKPSTSVADKPGGLQTLIKNGLSDHNQSSATLPAPTNTQEPQKKAEAMTTYHGPAVTTHLGHHLLAEFYHCNSNVLNNLQLIKKIMTDAAVACGATVVQNCFHQFNPYGVSGVIVIAESHLTIHTWPELEYAAVDLFTCGDACNPMVAYDVMREQLGSSASSLVELRRGTFDERTQRVLPGPVQAIRLAMHGLDDSMPMFTHEMRPVDLQTSSQALPVSGGNLT
ncbi:MAG: adenosylmethionine decarboxylase [Vampirovibrionales bacterium]|nr:adenosylmethionine decarboxylase [Vampirovibrionales bacterium]